MQFKFHLYVQKHFNRTYTVTPLPFYDMTVYGNNLEEIKQEIAETIQKRLAEVSPAQLHQFELNTKLYLQRVQVEVRPVDKKKRNKRREKLRLVFSLLVEPLEDGQLFIRVPKLGQQGPAFYVYTNEELHDQAQTELTAWLDGQSLEQLQEYVYARSETLEVLEIDIPLKKLKEREEEEKLLNPFGTPQENFWALKELGINMNAQAAEGRFRRTYRRDDVIEDIMQTLIGQRHNSVLLVGQSEAGKTAIIHEIVRRIQRGDCPDALKERTVWMLSPDRIIAGAQFIGTWEERINNIADECRKKGHILFVEDLPGLLEIGRWSKSDSNVALALRPHLASGELIMLGEGLPERVAMGDNIGASFMNLFRRVEVAPMSEEETSAVLNNVARDLEREHNLRILPEAIETSVQLSRRFLPYRAFPGKAVRLLEETASEIGRSRPRFEHSDEPTLGFLRRRGQGVTNRQSVIGTFSRTSGMPEFIVNDAARMSLDEVEQYFQERLLGQPDAVNTVVNLVATVKAGLNDPSKPMGTLMFIGPTGVGKTQMAKTLATYLFGDANRLLRFDMSEYRDHDGIAKLIGVFGKEGELTRRVREQPFSVVLLDEFEKADPRIFDIFLQVLGEGRLTDSGGKTTSFHNSIIIMTSNLGANAKSFTGLGFARGSEARQSSEVDEALRQHYRRQVEEFFRPEFVNRIDYIVVFGQLDPTALRSIATRELGEILLRDGITRRNLLVEIEDSVIDLVLMKGYSPAYGARPLKREIERMVVSPMARELAQRSAQDTNLLRIAVDRSTQQLYLKSVPIDQANTTTTVELRSSLTDSKAKKLRLDSAQLIEGFALLRRRMADWLEGETYKTMRQEKDELLKLTQQPNFWDNPEEARNRLSRFYFVDRLTKRVQQLYDRAEYMEDFAVLINRERDLRYQSDIARDYEELYRDVAYLDIEMATAHLPHRNQAMLLFRPMGMNPIRKTGAPSEDWVRRLTMMYLQWAEHKGYDHDVYLLMPEPSAPGGQNFQRLSAGNFHDLLKRFEAAPYVDEIALKLEGSNVFGFLKGERGLHRLEKDGTDEIANVQVFAIPDGTNIDEWLHDYREIKVDIEQGRRPAPPNEKLTVIRLYSLEKQNERFIRDMRTNTRTAEIKAVMDKGQIDDFILSYLEKEDSGGWEDRFPPTFPY